jgi:NAD-dependent DNA ligase
MEKIDKIIFGDNQFFGINHMSQEKAQQLSEKFYDIHKIYQVYNMAFNAGINAVMLNSNERAKEICNHFRDSKNLYQLVSFYSVSA